MKINGVQPQDIYKSFMNSTVHSENSDKKTTTDISTDRVEISPESVSLSEARELTRQSGITADSAVDASSRSEKVEALKKQIESGEYNVASEDVAKSILTGNHLDSRA